MRKVRFLNRRDQWGLVSKTLHWLISGLIFTLIGLGWTLKVMPLTPQKIDLYYWHKSLGILVLVLIIARIAWLKVSPGPDPVPGLSSWERRAAKLIHRALYFLILAMPISGWLINSSAGIPFEVFWYIPLPPISPISARLEELFGLVHLVLFYGLAVVLSIHILAAFMHHFLYNDDVLNRMLPSFLSRRGL